MSTKTLLPTDNRVLGRHNLLLLFKVIFTFYKASYMLVTNCSNQSGLILFYIQAEIQINSITMKEIFNNLVNKCLRQLQGKH